MLLVVAGEAGPQPAPGGHLQRHQDLQGEEALRNTVWKYSDINGDLVEPEELEEEEEEDEEEEEIQWSSNDLELIKQKILNGLGMEKPPPKSMVSTKFE